MRSDEKGGIEKQEQRRAIQKFISIHSRETERRGII